MKTRIDAAKNFFELFTQRTEAYGFKHAVNGIAFDSRSNIRVLGEFTEVMGDFRVSPPSVFVLVIIYLENCFL